jgi:peroxiredoxin
MGPNPRHGVELNAMALARRRKVGWAVAALATILGAPSVGMSAAPELLQPLSLVGYPPGEVPPEFSGRTVDGRTVTLAGLRGRVVLVNFWASWCPDCRPEMPMFEQLHQEFGRQGLVVLGINAGEGAGTIRGYASELGLTFPLLIDPDGNVRRLYGVVGVPTTFLIARDGRAVARAIGLRDWSSGPARTLIRTLIAEPVR